MNPDLQTVLVVAAVATAVCYVLWRGYRFVSGGGGNSCGSCSSSSCDSGVELIEIGQAESTLQEDRDSQPTELERTT